MIRRLALFVAATLACTTAPAPVVEGTQVLFIGNSLTYVNDLPGAVASVALMAGDTMHVTEVAQGNTALIDHAVAGSVALRAVRRHRWNFVILQQSETPQPICRDTLVLAVTRFDPVVRAAEGRTAIFMPWTYAQYPGDLASTRLSARLAAAVVGGMFLPVGDAWASVTASNPEIQLYSSDGLHPSELGTYLAALVIYETLTEYDVRTLPASASVNGHPLEASSDVVGILRNAAHQAWVDAQLPYIIAPGDTAGVRRPSSC